MVWLDEVASFHKEGRYTKAVLTDGRHHLTDLTLDYLDAHLPPAQFCRINRGVIVSRDQVVALHTHAGGTGEIDCRTEPALSVSRGRLAAFKQWLEG